MQLCEASCIGDSQMKRFVRTAGFHGEQKLAVSGATTRQLIQLIRRELPFIRQTVYLWVAVNDILQQVNLNIIKHNFKTILQLLLRAGKKIIIINLPPILEDSRNNFYIKNLNKFLEQYKSNSQISLIDFHSVILQDNNPQKLYCQIYNNGARDKVHVSPNGHRKLLQLLQSVQ